MNTAPPVAVPRARIAEERGRTVIPDAVVAKIAGRVADEVEGTRGMHRGLGSLLGGSPRPAKAQVKIAGTSVTVRLSIAVTYPHPVRQTTRDVRERVSRRVLELTGLTVRHVDIEVSELVRDARTA
ncbi:hypothetical protein Nans01_19870 [Nocardiopsis ansamitocini]|uniref:Asp23/Gls24 family envelope stress response protein n=2 Tax=Nocardiopsis ansamitocini TaxID=1670832 RepID=A0A9W6P5Q5_9ACTN|nr:hypothetical protein Nans01_19870 [Nocardiopsis ansamitocini]